MAERVVGDPCERRQVKLVRIRERFTGIGVGAVTGTGD